MRLDSWFGSHTGKVRTSNQDCVGCHPEIELFVVADGMGGMADGEVASRMAVAQLRDCFATPEAGRRGGFWKDLLRGKLPTMGADQRETERLIDAVRRANRAIFDVNRTRSPAPDRSWMGTTVVALHCQVEQTHAWWAHVGDSRLYRLRQGKLQLLTADDTLPGEAFRDQSDVPIDLPHSNRLLRSLGIEADVAPSLASAAIEIDDLFLLCSDGVSGMLPAVEISTILNTATDLESRGKTLIQRALDAGGRDNTSAVLVLAREG